MNVAASTAVSVAPDIGGTAFVSSSDPTISSATKAPSLPVPPGVVPGSVMLELLSAQRPTSSLEETVVESEVERKFFRDSRCVDVGESGEVTMTFGLSRGGKWKKRVWPRMEHPQKLLRWNSVEELLGYLISFDRHQSWISTQVPQRSPSGTILFFDRSKTKKYRSDGYDWKMRKTMSNTIREDRMKLRVGGYQLVYGCYAHSASDPNFHRRTYWLIQNPNIIMVHYLDSREFEVTSSSRHQNVASLAPHLVPTDWAMMSISDNNLCTLLDQTPTTVATKALLSHLPAILHSNILEASTLDQVLVLCNAGLPVDAFEEYSRSKKPASISDAYLNKDLEGSVNDAKSGAKGSVSQVPPPSPSSSLPSPSMPHGGQSSGQASKEEVLKVLSQSPHIIMCCPNKGSVSYILTVPTTDASSSTQTLPRILPSPSTERQGPLVFGPKGVRTTKNHRISSKGKEKASSGPGGENRNVLDCIQQTINGIINPTQALGVRGGGQSSQQDAAYSNVATPSVVSTLSEGVSSPASVLSRDSVTGSHDHAVESRDHTAAVSRDHAVVSHDSTPVSRDHISVSRNHQTSASCGLVTSSRDYDPEKFSKFANFLVKMDPIESLSRIPDDEPTTSVASRTDSMESEPMDSMECGGACDSNAATPPTSSLRGEAPMGVEPCPSPCLAPNPGNQEQEEEDFMSWLFPEPGSLTNSPSQGAVSTADSDSWNGLWQNCNPESIKNWLQQSAIPLDHTGTSHQGNSIALSSSSSCQPESSQHLPQDLQDFIFESTSSLNPPSSSSSVSTAIDFLSRHPPPNGTDLSSTRTPGTPMTPVTPMNPGGPFHRTSSPVANVPPMMMPDPSSLGLHHQGGAHLDEFFNPNSQSTISIAAMGCNSNSLAMQEGGHMTDFLSAPLTPMMPLNCDANLPSSHPHLNNFIHGRHSISASPTASIMTPLIPDTATTLSVVQDRSHLGDFILNNSRHSLSSSPAPPMTPLTPDTNPASIHDHARLNELIRSRHSLSSSPAAAANLTLQAPDSNEYLRPSSTNTNSNTRGDAVRKISDASVCSEPIFDLENSLTSSSSQGYPPHQAPQSQLHLSLPNLATAAESTYPSISVADADGSEVCYSIDGRNAVEAFPSGTSSGAMPHLSSNTSPSILQGAQMRLMEMMEDIPDGFLGSYRTNSSIPSSPSAASVTSSNMSMQDMFDESPSVKELCEMLSDSVNMQQSDMALTDSEQDQLFHAAETIQAAFRKYKNRRQLRSKEKNAALLIEKYYKRYRDAKEQKEQAARRIQHQYRVYKRRTRELDELSRAATFIQQMYRFQKTRRPSAHPYHRPTIQRNDHQL